MNPAMRFAFRLLLPFGACWLAACAAKRVQAVVDPRAAELTRVLREGLVAVRTATDSQDVTRQGPADLSALVGLAKEDIVKELGAPDCDAIQAGRQCWDDADVLYSFYHLPSGWVGGGPELLLMFDPAGRCTQAIWGGSK